MNKKFEELTTKDICSCIAIINAMCDEGILNIDLEKSKATIYVDRLTKYLENQNVMLQNRIDKARSLCLTIQNLTYDKFCKYETYLKSINEIDEILGGQDE